MIWWTAWLYTPYEILVQYWALPETLYKHLKSATVVRYFSSSSENNYLGTTYFPVFACPSLYFGLFILVLHFACFSALASAFQLIACGFQDWGCLVSREINCLLKPMCWLIQIHRLCRHQLLYYAYAITFFNDWYRNLEN